ncbi:hypothetical protein [Brevundimonas phoenicis]|uniref:hypothetical protein n=1 Tax=unclassified Brevundimonas TaxID=2622653 RepID=UPI00399F714B
MTQGFLIGDALTDGFRLIGRKPLNVLAWGILLTLPVLLSAFLVIDMIASIGVDAMAAEDPGPEAFAAIMRVQALSGLLNLLQMCVYVLVIAAVCRAVLWPGRAPGRIFDLRVGMDEARVAVACVAIMIGCYGVLFVILLLAFAFGAALWMVSEAAAMSLGVIVGLAGLVGVAWAALRASMIIPASVGLKDFAFVDGWRLTKGRVAPLLGLAVTTFLLAVLVQVLIVTIVAVVVFAISIPFWPQLLAWAEGMAAGAAPQLNAGVVMAVSLALFPVIAAYYGVITVVTTAPWVSACRQMLDAKARDETSVAALS